MRGHACAVLQITGQYRQKGWQAVTENMGTRRAQLVSAAGRPAAPVFDSQTDFPGLVGQSSAQSASSKQQAALNSGVWQPGTPERPTLQSRVAKGNRPAQALHTDTQPAQAAPPEAQDLLQRQLLAGHPWANSGLIKVRKFAQQQAV